ncbi:MAG: flagellin lysine-N-methylase [Clostridia bacterium]|nr:flagellin lysine-N-methylase [Clostridia bacterium]
MIIKPEFFDKFKCIAGKCSDTCCAGWEIYADPQTADYYSMIPGENGDYVRSHLTKFDDGILLCLEGERCPFLRGDNLCELIIRLGEDSLCDICREHPRFYAETENLIEMGVGLCCPEAARLWLESPCDFIFEEDQYQPTQKEKEMLDRQMKLIDYLANGEGLLGERFCSLLGCGKSNDALYSELCKLYSSLELLDARFAERFYANPREFSDKRMAKLAAYFVFRYYFELGEEMCLKFCAASLIMIASLDGELGSSAKDYSKEVEYDTDNLERIYAFLSDCNSLGPLCAKMLKQHR